MFITVLLIVVLCLPLFLGAFFRVNTSHIFFSLMAGELLARYFANEAGNVVGLALREHQVEYGEILLLVLPMVVTSIILKGTLSRKKLILHIVPLAITGVILAAFLLPLLPPEIEAQVADTELGERLLNMHRIIVGAVVGLQLVSLWLLNRKDESKLAGKRSK